MSLIGSSVSENNPSRQLVNRGNLRPSIRCIYQRRQHHTILSWGSKVRTIQLQWSEFGVVQAVYMDRA
jgi:hypothetical protein